MALVIDYGSDHCSGIVSNHFTSFDDAATTTWSDFVFARVKTSSGEEKIYGADFGCAGCHVPDEILEAGRRNPNIRVPYRRYHTQP